MKKTLLLIFTTALILLGLYLAENNDYFKADYNELTEEEQSIFTREADPRSIYAKHFGYKQFSFPRQEVNKIKLFENKPIVGTFTSKTLKSDLTKTMVDFFNDSTNFSWGETTWSPDESEYILRFYNNDKIVGKIHLCLDCSQITTRPFTPNVKFGGLRSDNIRKMIIDKENWK